MIPCLHCPDDPSKALTAPLPPTLNIVPDIAVPAIVILDMDPFAAVGLAGNIVQFVDILFKVLRSAQEIHHSACGLSENHVELEQVLKDLRDITERLQDPQSQLGGSVVHAGRYLAPATSHPGIEGLASQCKGISDALISKIENLRVQDSSKHRWRCCGKALKSVWKRADIEDLHSRVTIIRQQLSFHLHVENKTQLESLRQGCDALRKDAQTRSETLGRLEQSLLSHEQRAKLLASKDDVSKIFEDVAELVDAEADRRGRVFKSLYFPSIHERHSNIAEAHKRTFQWIFRSHELHPKDPRSRILFNQWLRSQHGIYWISGKPGSGKSTLMKYLCNCPETRSNLESWAAGGSLVIAKFFYWHGGTKMQKTLQGLLQSLFFEIFRQRPDWIRVICPSRWSSSTAELDPWSIREIINLIRRLAKQDFGRHKFCFFIDGLDEHEGNLEEVVHCLKSLDCSTSIKLCLSSRPWNCFEDAFGQSELMLRLEDLTREDMEKYVQDSLVPELQRSRLPNYLPFAWELRTEILEKAQGVFLWVFLAVQSLRRGITEGDTVATLRKRLHSFPPELHDFFNLILGSVEPIYRVESATLLSAALTAPEPLSAMAYSFFMEEEDPDFAIKLEWSRLQNTSGRHDLVRRRINARCKGLLQVYKSPPMESRYEPTVDFLHRTVREFLMSRDIQIFHHLPSGFRVDRPLCRAVLANLKSCSASEKSRHFQSICALLEYAEVQYGDSDTALIDELDHHCVDFYVPFHEKQQEGSNKPSKPLLEKMIEHRILSYLKTKVATGTIDPSSFDDKMLITCASGDRLEFFRLMLKSGVNPNRAFGSIFFRQAILSPQGKGTFPILRLLLIYGADIHLRDSSGRLIWMKLILDQALSEDCTAQCVECAEIFLSYAADPNAVFNPSFGDTSAWEYLLHEMSISPMIQTPNDVHYRLIKLFLVYGANPHVSVKTASRHLPASGIFYKILPDQLASNLEELLSTEMEYWRTRDLCMYEKSTLKRKREINELEQRCYDYDRFRNIR